MKLILLFVTLGALVLTGCADPYRNLYEGLKTRDSVVNPHATATPHEPPMPYDQYKAEREKLQQKDTEQPHGADPAY